MIIQDIMSFALFLGSVLLAWSWNVCTGQCYLNPSVSTRPSENKIYRTDEMDLKIMMVSLLDFVSIIKDEYWGKYGENLTLTYPQDGSCAILGEGFPLDTVAASNTQTQDTPWHPLHCL